MQAKDDTPRWVMQAMYVSGQKAKAYRKRLHKLSYPVGFVKDVAWGVRREGSSSQSEKPVTWKAKSGRVRHLPKGENMSHALSLDKIMEHFQESWRKLPDYRKPNNNTKYEVADAGLPAYSVFFMQSASFLAHQRDMNQRKGQDNAGTLFGVSKIPSDNQIRNLLDPVTPDGG